MISEDKIKENVINWTDKYMDNFSFRTYQLEYIVSTISSILNDKMPLNIIEAPTGSGKSIIVVIMAGVLDKFYHKKSYILCSDLYLWDQYANVIIKNNLYFGKIKGTWNNYVCDETGSDFSLAPCRLSNVPYAKLFNIEWCYDNDWECASHCEYINERYKALHSNVTLMTYQLYFPYMCDDNLQTADDYNTFTPRDVVFCDECHNVPELCQQYCTLVFDFHKDFDRYRNFLDFCKVEQIILEDGTEMRTYNVPEYMNRILEIYERMKNTPYNEQKDLLQILKELKSELQVVLDCNEALDKIYNVNNKKLKKKRISKREYLQLDNGKYIDKLACSIKMYINFADGSEDYIVKTDNMISDPTNYKNKIWPDNPIVSYKFAKEDALVYRCILSNQASTIMLSATVGDHKSFDDNIGSKYLNINESNMQVIPSTFDFSKSPIYYLPGNKMSQSCIDISFPNNAKIINSILKSPKHINEKGIIHTGSYKNAYDLLSMLDPEVKKRVYIYNTSKEKQDILSKYKNSYNGVLIGPTLTEGIDFPNDGCRFIIILKIPYPYLGDNLVKAKLSLFPRWYNSETANNVIQGIGRGNRTPDDWSTTYILDGCFTNLYQETRLQYPAEMRERIFLLSNNKKEL